jgi:hypothetical protein
MIVADLRYLSLHIFIRYTLYIYLLQRYKKNNNFEAKKHYYWGNIIRNEAKTFFLRCYVKRNRLNLVSLQHNIHVNEGSHPFHNGRVHLK